MAIETLYSDRLKRQEIGQRARAFIKDKHSPRKIGDLYFNAIEKFSKTGVGALRRQMIDAVAAIESVAECEQELINVARAINFNLPVETAQRQLLIDVSCLVQSDVGTGIQRVARCILSELLASPPEGFRVEPVYTERGRSNFYYAREYSLKLLGCPDHVLSDTTVEFSPHDIFLGLDLTDNFVKNNSAVFEGMRNIGVKIHFVVYDLLPILRPRFFMAGASELCASWLATITTVADGLVCISRALAGELMEWLKANPPPRQRSLFVDWFHLGSNIEYRAQFAGLSENAHETLALLGARLSFLTVSTIEPRKGHAQTLSAFEQLWRKGVDVNLVLVGSQGWMVETFVEKLRNHPELGKRLFWLEGINDEYLEKIYAASACLISASEGEGFGLSLIEGARHGLSVIARDLEVFREIAGENATYFSGDLGDDLAKVVQEFLLLKAEGNQPDASKIDFLTWKQSADQLKRVLASKEPYYTWCRFPSPGD